MSNVEPVIHILLQRGRAIHFCQGDALAVPEELYQGFLSTSCLGGHRENVPGFLWTLCALRNWQGSALGR